MKKFGIRLFKGTDEMVERKASGLTAMMARDFSNMRDANVGFRRKPYAQDDEE